MSPARAVAHSTRFIMRNPFNPLSYTDIGRNAAAAAELLERTTRRYKKPTFGIAHTSVRGMPASVTEEAVWHRPFCNLIHFRKHSPGRERAQRAAASDLRAPFGTLRHPAARHGGGDAALRRRLHHRLAGCALRAPARRQFRSRRLHRLCDGDDRAVRGRCACDGRLPAFGSSAFRHRADGNARESSRSAQPYHERRPDRHPRQPDRGEQACRGEGHQLVPAHGHHLGSLAECRAMGGWSIPASSSLPGSWS